jgi:ribosomal-protein-alanine N-acetyltransferase
MRALEAGRITLEPQTAEHADEMFTVLSDPAIYVYENAPPPSVEWLRIRYKKLETRLSADGRELWLNWVVRLRSGELIGYVQATVFPEGRAAIAYEFASAYWGQGLAREAVEALIRELTGHYRVPRLTAVAKSANGRSMRLLERLHFTPASPHDPDRCPIEPDETLFCREMQATGAL